MATTVTVETVLADLRKQQAAGSRVATVVGVCLIAAATADAHSNAQGTASFSSYLLRPLMNERAFGVTAIVLQTCFLAIGFFAMTRGRWQTAHAFRFYHLAKQALADRGKPKSDVKFLLVGLLFSVLWLPAAFLAFQAGSLVFPIGINVPVTIVLATCLAFDLTSALFVARYDPLVVAGLISAAAVTVFGKVYGSAGAIETAKDLYSWELALFALVVMGLLYVFVEREKSLNKVLLYLSEDTVPKAVTRIPTFAEGSGRSIYVQFIVQDIKLAVLYGSPDRDDLEFINVDDPKLCLPLQNHSLTFWNLSLLEKNLPTGKLVTDSARYFQAVGSLTQMATADDFRNRKHLRFDPNVVLFASDVFFNNKHFAGLLDDLAHAIFREKIQPYARAVSDLDLKAKKLRSAIQLDPLQTFELSPPKDMTLQEFTGVRHALAYKAAKEHSEDISDLESSLQKTVWAARESVEEVSTIWNEKIRQQFDIRSKEATSSDSEHQTSSLMDALGLRFRFLDFADMDQTIAVRSSLELLREKIDIRLNEAERAWSESIATRDQNILEIGRAIINGPPVTPRILAEIYQQVTGKSLENKPETAADSTLRKPGRLN